MNLLSKTLYTAMLLTTPLTTFAEMNHANMDHTGHVHEKITTPTSPQGVIFKNNEAVFSVHGVVCSFCAQGIQKKLSKLNFINKEKFNDGVKTEIKDQRITVAFNNAQSVNLENINIIKNEVLNAGYEPQAVIYRINGKENTIKWENDDE